MLPTHSDHQMNEFQRFYFQNGRPIESFIIRRLFTLQLPFTWRPIDGVNFNLVEETAPLAASRCGGATERRSPIQKTFKMLIRRLWMSSASSSSAQPLFSLIEPLRCQILAKWRPTLHTHTHTHTYAQTHSCFENFSFYWLPSFAFCQLLVSTCLVHSATAFPPTRSTPAVTWPDHQRPFRTRALWISKISFHVRMEGTWIYSDTDFHSIPMFRAIYIEFFSLGAQLNGR